MNLQEKINRAYELKKERKFSEALQLYDEVGSFLMQEAFHYAHVNIDEGNKRKLLPKEYELVGEYLSRDDTVAKIYNNIATIFAEIGDSKKAEQYYEEAIAFIPKNSDYKDPYLGLITVREAQNKTTEGFMVLTKKGKRSIEPFIKAIQSPELEEIEGLSELTTQEIVEAINNFSDEVILGLAIPRPGGPQGTYGFMLNPRVFGILKSEERYSKVMVALMNRFAKATKSKSDWEKYVCKLRKISK